MLTKLTCLAVALAASTASAATVDPVVQTREDAQRVWYHDAELRIAEQDLSTARFEVMVSRRAWDQAVARRDARAAGQWAVIHFNAMQMEKDAFGRVQLHRVEHDLAREDFNRDANWVRAEARLSTRKRG